MKISSTFGDFKIIQSISKSDELLMMSDWESLVRIFDSKRVFMVSKKDRVFGAYLGRQECSEIFCKLLKNIELLDLDSVSIENTTLFERVVYNG
ncbi:hypothetical protein A33Q_0229 [Indibacter alkaliphilus LW1]|jgi:hypothetical protein|uniref:Uncharacterized protein n=1 Tax=Indibacter alkaliphilus (strain CCUG 57479 / KCTC 22604 / LW1) TaxID=1189612 RepID=S2DS18_INDAL|nr:hypothetical protein [Indibacter alkaliphilus]EPA00061.1 hypothetical protein A33Q_0229 [Indibacter alkaliphilus LW1]